MDAEALEVEVIVPTRDRARRLAALLDSLAGQTGVRFEVTVVDDGSRDATPGAMAAAGVRSIRLETPRGPGAARNAGWRAGRAPLVAFIDDDCVAAPGWLGALVAAHRRHPGALVQGRTDPHPAEAHRLAAFSRSQLVKELGPHFQTCNIAYPRALLERLGGFDEAFGHYAEDADLAWRAIESGGGAVFAPAALVHHAVHSRGALALIRDAPRWSDAVRAFARHPGMRRALHRGHFWKRSHEGLLLAALGAVLAPRTRGASLLLAAPYLRETRTQHGSVAGVAAVLPAHLALDLAEMAAMAWGSVRFRTLVL